MAIAKSEGNLAHPEAIEYIAQVPEDITFVLRAF